MISFRLSIHAMRGIVDQWLMGIGSDFRTDPRKPRFAIRLLVPKGFAPMCGKKPPKWGFLESVPEHTGRRPNLRRGSSAF